MVINIISRSLFRGDVTGPSKVVKNTIKGLEMLGVVCVYNQPIKYHDYNWIHDDKKAIVEAGICNKPVIIGPNIATTPDELPLFRKKLNNGSILLLPSDWVGLLWDFYKFSEVKTRIWPVGIDTIKFYNVERCNKSKVLVYFKQRDDSILTNTLSILNQLNFNYEVVYYGSYSEEEYIKILHNCLFGIWIGCSESQGIALQEAMSTNLPLIVIDSDSLLDAITLKTRKYIPYTFKTDVKNIKVTSAPYFDQSCGIVISNVNSLRGSINELLHSLDEFKPRNYIKEHLSLKVSATQLVSYFKLLKVTKCRSENCKILTNMIF